MESKPSNVSRVHYYCQKCKRIHSKKSLIEKHKEHIVTLSNVEFWKLQFKKSWKNYTVSQHQKTSGSKKQIQKSNYSKLCKK